MVKPELSGLPTAPDAPEVISAASEGVLRVGQIVAGRYEVTARLGAGGMGAVWRVHDRSLDEDVALKVILPDRVGDPAALARFRDEVKIARKITHPNVCRVFDLGESETLTFLTMELVEGSTLRHLLAAELLSPARALDMLQQIVDGVAAAHERGVVHRDLKPENVLVRRDGRCLVADFGLAREPGIGAVTTAAGAVGTPAYMSPEQLKGEKLDIRSDVFALGIVGYELLTGRSPFGQGSPGTISTAILRSEPPPLEVPGLAEPVLQGLREVLSRALAKDPDGRFASAGELGAALARARDATQARSTLRGLSEPEPDTSRAPAAFQWWKLALVPPLLFVSLFLLAQFPRGDIRHWRPFSGDDEEPEPQTPPGASASPSDADERATLVVLPFENLTGDAAWNGLSLSAPEVVRTGLRTMPEVRLSEVTPADRDAAIAAGVAFWVRGSVQRVGGTLRLSAQLDPVGDEKEALPGEPVEVDAEGSDVTRPLETLRSRVLDEARLVVRHWGKRRRAMLGTTNEAAKKSLLDYYKMVGPGPRKEHFSEGLRLLDRAIAADPAFVPALVERAHLRSMGAGEGTQASRMADANAGIEQALATRPQDPMALVTRCRLMQVALEVGGDKPTDASIERAKAACDAALGVAPALADVYLSLARLQDRACHDEEAMLSLERVLELDRSLSGRVLKYSVSLALANDRMLVAEKKSEALIAFHEEERRLGARSIARRAGIPPEQMGVYFRRGVVLLRASRLDEAERAFEREITDVEALAGSAWAEAAAIRGLLRVGKARGKAVLPEHRRRLAEIEAEMRAKAASDPSVAKTMVGAYLWVDPEAAVEWLGRLSARGSCEDAIWRGLVYRAAGKTKLAREALAACSATEQWEKRCVSRIESLLPR
ncbi:protein kinase domain-containing protein [Polyangium jinanense]|uniref:Protein kinase n=1 Tax=Polyangium jinanense TaxID=2829994 RepID=A0A9X3XBE1_9BACT|nr:serine/threonine-protein kinase [Polyangium jinanense]MDC3960002.1 protein kinase [Polyangium jinanense]MDC3986220.1 protein kinase [Polyangium jinanense]